MNVYDYCLLSLSIYIRLDIWCVIQGMRRRDWDSEVISVARLEQTEERFRERFNDQISQLGHVAEQEFRERQTQRYCCFKYFPYFILSSN